MYGIYSERLDGFLTTGSYDYCFTTKDLDPKISFDSEEKAAAELDKFYSIYKPWFVDAYGLSVKDVN